MLQVLLELQALHWQLRQDGHLAYQTGTPTYEFAWTQEHMESQARELRSELEIWHQHIAAIHEQYPLTCFLNTQQLVTAAVLTQAAIAMPGDYYHLRRWQYGAQC